MDGNPPVNLLRPEVDFSRNLSRGGDYRSTALESRAADTGGVQTDVVTTIPGRGHLPKMKWSEESQQVTSCIRDSCCKCFANIASIRSITKGGGASRFFPGQSTVADYLDAVSVCLTTSAGPN